MKNDEEEKSNKPEKISPGSDQDEGHRNANLISQVNISTQINEFENENISNKTTDLYLDSAEKGISIGIGVLAANGSITAATTATVAVSTTSFVIGSIKKSY
jgi:hypothetical protein